MNTLDPSAMRRIEGPLAITPGQVATPGAHERGVILVQEHRTALGIRAEAGRPQWTGAAVSDARPIDLEAFRIGLAMGNEVPPSRAAQAIVQGVELEPAGRDNTRARGRLGPGRHDPFNSTRLKIGKDPCDGVSCIQGRNRDGPTRHKWDFVESR
jgi:hypothetical protein